MLAILSSSLLFIAAYVLFVLGAYPIDEMGPVGAGILVFKTLVEVLSVFYGFAFLFAGFLYLLMRPKKTASSVGLGHTPPVVVLYLCCNDLERESLQSIASLSYSGEIFLVIHDDSLDSQANAAIDCAAEELMAQHPHLEVRVLRRPEKEGRQGP